MRYNRKYTVGTGVPQNKLSQVIGKFLESMEGTPYRLVSTNLKRRETEGSFDLLMIFEKETEDPQEPACPVWELMDHQSAGEPQKDASAKFTGI